MASLPKVARYACPDPEVDDAIASQTAFPDIFNLFSVTTDAVEVLKGAVNTLLGKTSAIGSVTIRQCNAAYGTKYGNFGRSFSRADIDLISNTEPGDMVYSFRTIFNPGISALESFLTTKTPPTEPDLKYLVANLLTYLLNKDEQEKVTTILKRSKGKEKLCECEVAVIYAQHYFTKLSTSSSYTLDQYYPNKIKSSCCSCGCGTVVGRHFGDTSLGCPDTWHGNLDILLDSCHLPVTVIDDDKKPDSPGGRSFIEVKTKENIEQYADTASQLVAQAIVFSFSQKKKHPELKHFLIPTVGVSTERIIYYFYDSEHDVLLKSPSFPIFEAGEVSILSVVASWLVVNYKLLCSGLSKQMQQKAKRANFFHHAGDLLPVYKNDLTLGGLSREFCSSVYPLYQPEYLVKCQFVENVEDIEGEKKTSRIGEKIESQTS